MRKFLKLVLATLVGQVILLLIVVLIGLNAISGLKKEEIKTIDSNAILLLDFKSIITDRSPSEEMEFIGQLSGESSAPMGLLDIINKIDAAAKDSRIKGIFMDFTVFGAGFAKAEELRNALEKFKSSGKFIYAYSDYYYNSTYYLASVATKVFMNPQGEMLFNGMVSDITFFKGTLEKLGVEVQVIKRGKFKGAVEPYIREDLSEENRLQIKTYVNSVFNELVADIAKSRNLTTQQILSVADSMLIRQPEDAKTYGFVDELYYKDQVLDLLRKELGIKNESDKINFAQLSDIEVKATDNSDRIAVVFASGSIVNGEGQMDEVGGERFAKTLRELRKDESIKAVVLRIDSRGGSALASEIIWREAKLLKAVKPLIVSMSDVAASGGYYMAACADTIVASPQTITGSIGVFGLIPNAGKLMKDKLGITNEYVGTGKYSDFGRIDRKMTEGEFEIIDGMVGRIYDVFKSRVSEGRGMTVDMVDSFGQGRVWTGRMAKEIGLVDVLGGIQDAIAIAQYKANIKSYTLVEYPKNKSLVEQIFGKVSGEEAARMVLKSEMGASYDTYQQIRKLSQMSGVQALLPYELLLK
jgi:protease-4